MILECLILREGITPVILGSSKVKYNFMPIPGSRKGEFTTSVCEIQKEEDVQYLLKTGQYREYDPERAHQEMLDRRAKQKENPFYGFKFEKYHELGYIIIDMRKPKKRYIDTTGTKAEPINLIPFKSEAEAYEYLKEELQFEEMDKVEGQVSDDIRDPAEPEISKRGLDALTTILDKDKEPMTKQKKESHRQATK